MARCNTVAFRRPVAVAANVLLGVLMLASPADCDVMCCMAMTASCLACKAGVSVEAYCADNTGADGCEAAAAEPACDAPGLDVPPGGDEVRRAAGLSPARFCPRTRALRNAGGAPPHTHTHPPYTRTHTHTHAR